MPIARRDEDFRKRRVDVAVRDRSSSSDVCLQVASIVVNVEMWRNRGDGAPTELTAESGAIVADQAMRSNLPDFYAAGD